MRVLGNGVIRRLFGPKREEDGSLKKLRGTRGTLGGGDRFLQNFGWEARREETTGKS
jgi:hypothetical protein